MQRDVEEALGNEVFWSGTINPDGKIISVKVGSRGNEDSVIINQNVARQGHVLIHNHPNGILLPSEADQNVAINSSDSSMGFYIVNNDISDVYVVVEPIKPKVLVKVDPERAAYYISNEGPLANLNENYEERPSQIELVKEIAAAFNGGKVGVFEAGTGVGKSYAYLIPSILWAAKNKERVVVSTGTINLQQQLIEKDIPNALKLVGVDLKAILIKGRQNYVCLRRLNDAAMERDLFSEDTEIFDKIVAWTKTSSTGSRTDLAFVPPENIWSKINSESDACMGGRCPHREECFVMKVRKEASDANLVVVNHHLLFADIESRMNGAGYDDTAVLPPYRHVVFDEAHGIEDSATSFFSESITRFKVMKQLNLLYRQWHGTMTGFLVNAATFSSCDDFSPKANASLNLIKEALLKTEEAAMDVMGYDFNCRITHQNKDRFVKFLEEMSGLKSALGNFIGMAREVLEGISDDDKDTQCVWETKTVLRRLDSILTLCTNFPDWEEHEDTVFWMQKVKLSAKKQGEPPSVFVQFVQTPLDVAPMMNMGVFEPMSSVVCTSATLRTGTNFSYWSRRTGVSFVEEDRLVQKEFDSPFPYKTNVLFAVPNDAPFPDNPEYQLYVEEILPKLILAAGGRTLVLFTSYDSLKNAYNSCWRILSNAGITAFKQGDDDRFRLLEKFKDDRESVLFATDSFWEGVDVPGESLSQVIIVKLPFAVPNDPVFAARSEAVEKKGGSAFFELSVPQAVIKFRQGFGRLVRRSSDRGVVIVLDRRIVEKSYGRTFTSSVPMTKRMYSPMENILSAVEKFLF